MMKIAVLVAAIAVMALAKDPVVTHKVYFDVEIGGEAVRST